MGWNMMVNRKEYHIRLMCALKCLKLSLLLRFYGGKKKAVITWAFGIQEKLDSHNYVFSCLLKLALILSLRKIRWFFCRPQVQLYICMFWIRQNFSWDMWCTAELISWTAVQLDIKQYAIMCLFVHKTEQNHSFGSFGRELHVRCLVFFIDLK